MRYRSIKIPRTSKDNDRFRWGNIVNDKKDAQQSPIPDMIAEYMDLKDQLTTLVSEESHEETDTEHSGLMQIEADINSTFEKILAADSTNPVSVMHKLEFLHREISEDCEVPGYLDRALQVIVGQLKSLCGGETHEEL